MKKNTAAIATTPERKLSHFLTIDLNRAVNVLAIDTVKRLYDFLYGRMSMMGYIRVHVQAYAWVYVCVRTG